MLKRSRALASAAAIAILTGIAAPAWAETLKEALALAYQTNPSLLAQRASQRALDESIVQARAGLRPQVDVNVETGYAFTENSGGSAEVDTNGDGIPDTTVNVPGSNSDGTTGGASIGLSQTIWSGGRIGHGITAAEANILAGRENLRDIEQTVLTSVI
ncbi:MAG: TolC family protein, partial [Brevundimonas sp.]